MRVLPFTVIKSSKNDIIVEVDTTETLYEHLHNHIDIQITFIKKGSGTLFLGNMFYEFRPKTVFLIGSKTPHVFNFFSPKNELEMHSIFFEPKLIRLLNKFASEREKSNLALLHKPSIGVQFQLKDFDLLENCFAGIENTKGLERIIEFINLINKLVQYPKKKIFNFYYNSEKYHEINSNRMNEIISFTLTHYSEKITLHQIAQQTHLTTNSFCKFFKKHTGKTYFEFLKLVRVEKAKNLLFENPYLSIKEVGYQVGFSDPAKFLTAFKQVCGFPPSELKSKLMTMSNYQHI